jgi:hypothetical protein
MTSRTARARLSNARALAQFGESLGADSLVLRRREAFDTSARASAAKNFSRARSACTRYSRGRAGARAYAFDHANASLHVVRKCRGNAHSIGISADEIIFVLKNVSARDFHRGGSTAIIMCASPHAVTAGLYTKLRGNPVIFFPLV